MSSLRCLLFWYVMSGLRLPAAAPFWWLLWLSWLLGECQLSRHPRCRLVWEHRAQIAHPQRSEVILILTLNKFLKNICHPSVGFIDTRSSERMVSFGADKVMRSSVFTELSWVSPGIFTFKAHRCENYSSKSCTIFQHVTSLCISVLPAGCKEEEFTWTNYLRMTKAQVAPKEHFASPGRVTISVQYNICWLF